MILSSRSTQWYRSHVTTHALRRYRHMCVSAGQQGEAGKAAVRAALGVQSASQAPPIPVGPGNAVTPAPTSPLAHRRTPPASTHAQASGGAARATAGARNGGGCAEGRPEDGRGRPRPVMSVAASLAANRAARASLAASSPAAASSSAAARRAAKLVATHRGSPPVAPPPVAPPPVAPPPLCLLSRRRPSRRHRASTVLSRSSSERPSSHSSRIAVPLLSTRPLTHKAVDMPRPDVMTFPAPLVNMSRRITAALTSQGWLLAL